MGSSLSKIVALLLSVLLLFIFPILNMFEKQDDTTQVFVLTETTKFVDSVRSLGYITPTMYREFTNKLAATNNIYEIEMEHYHRKFDPIYEYDYSAPAPTPTFMNDFNVNYRAYYTDDIMDVLFPATPTTSPTSSVKDSYYKMSKGDYFAVKVKNKNKTIATKIQEMLYNADFITAKILVKYGGMVKDENY
ncbi:MAG: hypothetical protein ACOYWZ_14655 [Bacillota bacterium]